MKTKYSEPMFELRNMKEDVILNSGFDVWSDDMDWSTGGGI